MLAKVLEAYETMLGKYRKRLRFGRMGPGETRPDGSYVAVAAVSLLPEKPRVHKDDEYVNPDDVDPRVVAVAAHANPALAYLLAKAIAVAELVGEPSELFYDAASELRAPAPAPTPAPAAAHPQAAPSADGKPRCAFTDAKGAVCGAEITEWDGKSGEQWAAIRKERFGFPVCAKHSSILKKRAQ